MDPHVPARTRLVRLHDRLVRLTASTTAGGMMMVGLPLALDYLVRPGDTLSGIAVEHGTSVDRLVSRNDLHRSGDRVVAGQRLRIPAAHGRPAASRNAPQRTAPERTGTASPDARRIVRYTVRPGDTPSGLAVRFHAWTAELVARNGSVLRVGETIEIPVVVAAERAARRSSGHGAARNPAPRTEQRSAAPGSRSGASTAGSSPGRATVRRVITRTALRHGVDPNLALAVSWQEAGWRMHHRSSAGAIGAMQIMPSTGRWMAGVVGRPLQLRDLQDNVTAGVVLLKVLEQQAPTRQAVAGYYQGLAGVRKHGMYSDTKRYVANVMALKHQFDQGHYPA